MFIKNEENWLKMFHKAWYIATTNSYLNEQNQLTLKNITVFEEFEYKKDGCEEI